MNAEVTAENKPDYTRPRSKHEVPSSSPPITHGQALTKVNVMFMSSSYLLEVLVILFHFSLKHVAEPRPGVNTSYSAAQHGLQGITEGLFHTVAVC